MPEPWFALWKASTIYALAHQKNQSLAAATYALELAMRGRDADEITVPNALDILLSAEQHLDNFPEQVV